MNHTFFALVAVLLLSSCAGSNTAKSPVTSLPTTSGHGEIKLIWNRNVGTYTGFLHPARDGSTICAVNRSGTFFLLREDDGGDALSSFRMETADTITAATSCGDGVVTAATDDGTLLVYDYDGSELWRKELNTRLIASPLVSDGSVFMLGQDGRISAYSARHGDLLWRYVLPLRTLVRTPVDSTPTAANGLIYAGMGNGNIVALQQNNGRVEWQTKLSFARKSGTLSDILDTTTPIVREDRLCAVAYQGHIGCLHTSSGQILWRQPLSAAKRVAVDEYATRVFAVDVNGNLAAYDAKNGEVLWSQELATAKTVAFVRGAVVVGFSDGTLAALTADDGSFIGSVDLSGEVAFLQPLNAEEVLGATLSGDIFRAVVVF